MRAVEFQAADGCRMSGHGVHRTMRGVRLRVWITCVAACSAASIVAATLYHICDDEVPIAVLVGAPDGLVRSLETGDVVSGWRWGGGLTIERSDHTIQLWLNRFGISDRVVYVSLHCTPVHTPESRSDGLIPYVAAVDYMPRQVSVDPEFAGRWRALGRQSGACEVRLERTGVVQVGGVVAPGSVWGSALGVVWIDDASGELRKAGFAGHRIVTLAPMSRRFLYEDVRSGTQWLRGDDEPPR